MKNPELKARNSLPRERLFAFISQGEQYQNPNFLNLKRLSILDLSGISI
jgi:hypothetical protein